MRVGLLAVAASIWLVAGIFFHFDEEWIIVVGGDTNGYLSPCGCTKPMIGGIRKRATLVNALTSGKRHLVLENGGLVENQGRQDALKAEALAQALKGMGVDAITFGYSEARLGAGIQIQLNQLSGGKLVNSALEESDSLEIAPFAFKGPFVVGALDMRASLVAAALNERAAAPEAAVKRLLAEAAAKGLAPLLMLQGSRSEAVKIAEAFSKLRLIVYRSQGNASESPEKIGGVWLVSPGGNGLYVLKMSYSNGVMRDFSALRVEAAIKDDAHASRQFKDYLNRVEEERLLDRFPRTEGFTFAGTAACGRCHAGALSVWRASGHSHALRTLEKVGQSKDPECVICHVVGLAATGGFSDRMTTPTLADVGCESCHGSGAAHARSPKEFPMPKVGAGACMKCHTTANSPGFDFPKFWKKIAHN